MNTPEYEYRISLNGFTTRIGPADPQEWAFHESLIRADYERCHPDESFEDLKTRARISKEDKGLLYEWMALAARRAAAMEEKTATPMRAVA